MSNDENHADVETSDVSKTINFHTNKSNTGLLNYSPEINNIVSTVHNIKHNSSQRTKNSKRPYNNTDRNNPKVNIYNNKGKSKIGIKKSSKNIQRIEKKFNSIGKYHMKKRLLRRKNENRKVYFLRKIKNNVETSIKYINVVPLRTTARNRQMNAQEKKESKTI